MRSQRLKGDSALARGAQRLVAALRAKPGRKPVSKGWRWVSYATLTVGGLMGLHAAFVGLVGYRALAEMPHLAATVESVSALRTEMGLFAKDEHDPSFDAQGRLLPTVRADRCGKAITALNAYERAWVDQAAFQGRPVRDHAMPVAIAMVLRESAYAQGCTTREDVLAAATRYRKIQAADMSFQSFGDIVRRLPVYYGWDHGPMVASVLTMTRRMYDQAISVSAVQSGLCRIDERSKGASMADAMTRCDTSS